MSKTLLKGRFLFLIRFIIRDVGTEMVASNSRREMKEDLQGNGCPLGYVDFSYFLTKITIALMWESRGLLRYVLISNIKYIDFNNFSFRDSLKKCTEILNFHSLQSDLKITIK